MKSEPNKNEPNKNDRKILLHFFLVSSAVGLWLPEQGLLEQQLLPGPYPHLLLLPMAMVLQLLIVTLVPTEGEVKASLAPAILTTWVTTAVRICPTTAVRICPTTAVQIRPTTAVHG